MKGHTVMFVTLIQILALKILNVNLALHVQNHINPVIAINKEGYSSLPAR